MDHLWNKLHLPRPPLRTWKIPTTHPDVKNLNATISKILRDFESLSTFNTEAAILSRVIYRMKRKFRSDKGMKNTEKVNRVLLNFLSISLDKELNHLKEHVEIDGSTTSMPAKQSLEYVLVRIQGFAKLMCRLESVALMAGQFWKTRINDGHAWTMAMVAYALISRIWTMSRYLIKKSCEWYANLYKFLDNMKIVGKPWLPENYKLLNDLKNWLNLSWIERSSATLKQKPLEKSIFNLIEAGSDEEDFNVGENVSKIIDITEKSDTLEYTIQNDENPSPVKNNHCNSMMEEKIDTGKRIDRAAFESKCKRESFQLENKNISNSILDLEIDSGTSVDRATFRKHKLEENSLTISSKKRKIAETSPKSEFSEKEHKKTKPKEKKIKIPRIPLNSLNSKKSQKEKTIKQVKDVKTKKDLIKLLELDSYNGLDKLQWNIAKNNVKKLMQKLEEKNKSEEKLVEKAISRLRTLVN